MDDEHTIDKASKSHVCLPSAPPPSILLYDRPSVIMSHVSGRTPEILPVPWSLIYNTEQSPSSNIVSGNVSERTLAIIEAINNEELEPSRSYMGDPRERRRKEHRCKQTSSTGTRFVAIEDAFQSALRTYYYNASCYKGGKDIRNFLNTIKGPAEEVIVTELEKYQSSIKFNLVLEATYTKVITFDEDGNNDDREYYQDVAFKTPNYPVYAAHTVKSILCSGIEKILAEEASYQGKGSGWTLHSIDGIMIRISKFVPLRGSSYIPLPNFVSSRKAVVNPKNYDQKCFMWAVLAKHVEGDNPHRVDYRYENLVDKYNFSNIQFPTIIKNIDIFERDNQTVSVNVYCIDDDKKNIYPRRVCKKVKHNHFDLLLISNTFTTHYCYIKNFERLVRLQMTKHHGKINICRRCFTHYPANEEGDQRMCEHNLYCSENKPCRVIMPKEDEHGNAPVMAFKNYLNKFRLPIVIYADFECILEKPKRSSHLEEEEEEEEEGEYEERIGKATKVLHNHIPMSFCIKFIVDRFVSPPLPQQLLDLIPNDPILYRGRDAPAHFISILTEICREIVRSIEAYQIPLRALTDEETREWDEAENCAVCNKFFANDKVRDHCHLTGAYRAPLCNSCNLKRQRQTFIPVFIHNASNYDSHFIVRQLGIDKDNITVIPSSSEKYIAFSKHISNRLYLRFVDTYRFMGESLEKLVNNLTRGHENLNSILYHTSLHMDHVELVSRKGVYPYEYTDSWERLDETSLPAKKHFYSSLTDESITDADYEHALKVWETFNCQTLGEYSDLYLKSDVLLLADVFEAFRDVCLKTYGLDCAHYYTAPGYSFDCMLKITQVRLELLTDYNMYMFMERGIRGGITSCIERHAIANNPYTGAKFDPTTPTTFLFYSDANNLYGWSMSRPLPMNNFRWMTAKELETLDVENLDETDETGYILQVNVDYPQQLHDDHNAFPFLPLNQIPPKTGSKYERLLNTLEPKRNYVVHYVALKQALKHGLRLEKIIRGISFKQTPFLAKYINLNTELRQQAANDFEKNFYKLMNNSCFGKTMENVRKRMNMYLVNDSRRLQKLVCRPTFKDRIVYGENICAVVLEKDVIKFDKPIYVGLTVLDVSKTLMYWFHYDIMLPIYGKDCLTLLYQDTDSLFYNVKTADLYADILNNSTLKDVFDTSDYPRDHPCFSNINKKVIGKFKDEYNARAPHEFVGLRAKLYACRCYNAKNVDPKSGLIKKAKGVRRHVLKKEIKYPPNDKRRKNIITFDDYLECLYAEPEKSTLYRDQIMFRTRKHHMMTVLQTKKALSNTDDKRIINADRITTLAYGHYSLQQQQHQQQDEQPSSSKQAKLDE
jgi:hypothetical protein